jgi:hypothetical protein
VGQESGVEPPSVRVVEGSPDRTPPNISQDFENFVFGEFLLDSLVANKRRLSTYHGVKRWTKEEDEALVYAVKVRKYLLLCQTLNPS